MCKINKNKWRVMGTVLIVLVLLAGCKASKQKPKVAPEERSAFYTLTLTKDSVQNTTSVEVKNTKVVDVKIRYSPDVAKATEPNFLKIEIADKSGKIIHAYTEHPLHKRFDLYSESGKIEAKLISLYQGEVVFRVPYFDSYKKITIIETVNFKEAKPRILKNEK